jgi:hypothetical protein
LFVDADDIHVTVEDGIATLTGVVVTWSERRDANAYNGGAIGVDKKLIVLPGEIVREKSRHAPG